MKESAARKKKFDETSRGRKGDFSVHTCDGDKSKLLCVLECKPPRSSKSDDLVKVGNCLKDCIDESAMAGSDTSNSRLVGIVCEGKVA